ncbi:MAG: hypothetical protein IT228_03525 [Flavobacteriales bacterium]|nr:hypothetical protein [Flavobacteriales bacterium]MCC6576391.1 hypothetical protein [Flavobacteriales bacterium]NUQ14948.1 hypothetical protein [Flavobacteriales bacterium]
MLARWSLRRAVQVLVPVLLGRAPVAAQQDSLPAGILLDEAVVVAQREGFDVAAFIARVRTDTTFRHAFLNLRVHPHRTEGELRVHDPRDRERAGFFRTAHLVRIQGADGADRTVQVTDSVRETGRLRQPDGDHRYLTARMFESLFFPEGARPVPRSVADLDGRRSGGSRFDRYRADLKRFMFSPGEELEVPIVGDKLALFDPDIARHYAMSIWSGVRNGHDCWVFSADMRPDAPRNAVVVRTMDTWFDKASGQVIAREYRMQHAGLILRFDIAMVVDLDVRDGLLVPTHVHYDGDWDLPMQRRERVRFFLRTTQWEAWP